jgi:hypothetical protein
MKQPIRRTFALGLLLLSGCYRYVPEPVDSIAPGTAVRARVTAPEAERLTPVLGRSTRLIHGELVERSPDGLMLQVRGAGSTAGTALYQRVTLLPSAVQELEVRTLDRWKTAGLAGAVVVGVAAAILQLSGESETSTGEGPTPEAVRVPSGAIR